MMANEASLTGIRNSTAIDEAIFIALYEQYWRSLYRYAYHHCGDDTAAEEIVQDVFVSIWQRRGEIGPISATFDKYLMKAVRLKVFDFHRVQSGPRKQENLSSLAMNEPSANLTEEAVLFSSLKERIEQLLEQLPVKWSQVYRLNRQQGMDKTEIARTLSISEKTVDHYLYNTLDHLRDHLER